MKLPFQIKDLTKANAEMDQTIGMLQKETQAQEAEVIYATN